MEPLVHSPSTLLHVLMFHRGGVMAIPIADRCHGNFPRPVSFLYLIGSLGTGIIALGAKTYQGHGLWSLGRKATTRVLVRLGKKNKTRLEYHE